MLSEVRRALSRKFGPAPAWAWLGVLTVAVVLWRQHKAAAAGGGQAAVGGLGVTPDASAYPVAPMPSGGGTAGSGGDTGGGDSGGGGAKPKHHPPKHHRKHRRGHRIRRTKKHHHRHPAHPAHGGRAPVASAPRRRSGPSLPPLADESPTLRAHGRFVGARMRFPVSPRQAMRGAARPQVPALEAAAPATAARPAAAPRRQPSAQPQHHRREAPMHRRARVHVGKRRR